MSKINTKFICPNCGWQTARERRHQKVKAINWLLHNKALWEGKTIEYGSDLHLKIARALQAAGIYSPVTYAKDIKVRKLIQEAQEITL